MAPDRDDEIVVVIKELQRIKPTGKEILTS